MCLRALGVWASAWLGLALAVSASGEASMQMTNGTVITSKKLTFDYRNHVAVFEKDVVVTDPSVKIESDRLTVVFEKDNNPDKIIAMGNVRITTEDKRAVCERAVYQVKLGRLDLAGNPVVRRGQDVLKGRLLTFWKDQEKVEGEDVHLEMYMQGEESLKTLLKE